MFYVQYLSKIKLLHVRILDDKWFNLMYEHGNTWTSILVLWKAYMYVVKNNKIFKQNQKRIIFLYLLSPISTYFLNLFQSHNDNYSILYTTKTVVNYFKFVQFLKIIKMMFMTVFPAVLKKIVLCYFWMVYYCLIILFLLLP